MPKQDFIYDHLDLEEDRPLIREACDGNAKVYLKYLRPGWTGADLWKAQWEDAQGIRSAHYVFKIGPQQDLVQEYQACKRFSNSMERDLDARIFPKDAESKTNRYGRVLLRQMFLGNRNGETKTPLKQYVRERKHDSDSCAAVINRLYSRSMTAFHEHNEKQSVMVMASALGHPCLTIQTDETSLSGRLLAIAAALGLDGLERSIAKWYPQLDIRKIAEKADRLSITEETFSTGAIHGDLHAENVLVGPNEIDIIDYGETKLNCWHCMDFLMLECSLKFSVGPKEAELADWIEAENLLDTHQTNPNHDFSDLSSRLLGTELRKITRAVHCVRAKALKFTDFQKYRRGLIVLMAGMSKYPNINRPLLFHNLAHHIHALSGKNSE